GADTGPDGGDAPPLRRCGLDALEGGDTEGPPDHDAARRLRLLARVSVGPRKTRVLLGGVPPADANNANNAVRPFVVGISIVSIVSVIRPHTPRVFGRFFLGVAIR